MAELIISISGMRGIIGENLSPMIAAEYGAAFGTFLRRRFSGTGTLTVALGRDSRPSGQMLTWAVGSGLCAAGVHVVDLGIVTTPCVGIMLRELGCAGGVVITASHNPVEYNGIKLLMDNGIAPAPETAAEIRQMYFDKDIDLMDSLQCGQCCFEPRTDEVHIEKVLSLVDTDLIASKKFKVVLDSVNGAGGRIGVKLLETLGCEVHAMNYEATGKFAHTPEPTKENLKDLCKTVGHESAVVGFAQDPDADRVAVVDENGTYIGEEYSLAMAVQYVLSKEGPEKAAANLSTSRMVDDVAKRFGGSVIRTPVGEANVAKAMIENGCTIGGEGNGGVIDLRVGPVRDSLVGMALILQLMAETDKTVSELVKEIGGYTMVKTKVGADKQQAAQIIEKVKQKFPGAKVDESDGARFDFEDGWVHVRTSNTEPVMRIIVETVDEAGAKRYLDAVNAIRDEILN